MAGIPPYLTPLYLTPPSWLYPAVLSYPDAVGLRCQPSALADPAARLYGGIRGVDGGGPSYLAGARNAGPRDSAPGRAVMGDAGVAPYRG
jgi:hypothetical protein